MGYGAKKLHFSQFKKYIMTIVHLKSRQILHQVYRLFVPISRPKSLKSGGGKSGQDILFLPLSSVYMRNQLVFVLGRPVYDLEVSNVIVGPKDDYLYLFSFFYFDFVHHLNGQQLNKLFLRDVKLLESRENFYHPYVVSKRIINLILLFICKDRRVNDGDSSVLHQIHKDASYLYANIEYHVDGNHLLTNFAALAIYERRFLDETESRFFDQYLIEFTTQFESGMHYERSISYTSQLLHESFLVFQEFKCEIPNNIFSMIDKSLGSLKLFSDLGNRIDFVDNIFEQSFEIDDLIDFYTRAFERKFEIKSGVSPTEISHYVTIFNKNFALCVDCGYPTPAFQPGHSHDSSGAIELSFKSHPIFISGNVSTYENCDRRLAERSRFNYSKVVSEGIFQDVWSSFRVAERVRPVHTSSELQANCLVTKGIRGSKRIVSLDENRVSIVDSTAGSESFVSQFIVSSNCIVSVISHDNVIIDGGDFKLELRVSGAMTIEDKSIATRYGVIEGTKLIKCTANQTENILNIREIHS